MKESVLSTILEDLCGLIKNYIQIDTKEAAFDETIYAIYINARPISAQYINLFRSLRDDLYEAESSEDIKDTLYKFKKMREEVIFARTALSLNNIMSVVKGRIEKLEKSLINPGIEERHIVEVSRFFNTLALFFIDNDISVGLSRMARYKSRLAKLIENDQLENDLSVNRNDLLEDIDVEIEKIVELWGDVEDQHKWLSVLFNRMPADDYFNSLDSN